MAYFGMAEGRVRNAGGTLTSEYMIKDQQGNVRVSFESSGGTAVVRQENSYYPYGLTMPGSVTPTAANKNLYNGGSEWQDDFGNLPDLQQTFYRMYDAALGRFLGVDPDPEHAEGMSTYQYAFANPVMFNDPLGDKGGDYYQNPTESGASGINAVAFHGGYQRISHASGNHWSNALDESRVVGDGPYAAFWESVLGFIDDGGSGDLNVAQRHGEWVFWGQTTWRDYASGNEKDLNTVELTSKWYREAKANQKRYPVGLKEFIAIASGEAAGSRIDARNIASAMINRMIRAGTNLNNSNWKYLSIHTKGLGGTVRGNYQILNHLNQYEFKMVTSMNIDEIMSSDLPYIQGALDAYNNWGKIDYSKGAIKWSATPLTPAARSRDQNFQAFDRGELYITTIGRNTTYFGFP